MKRITPTRNKALPLTVLLTPEGTVIRINREVLEAAGIRASEVIGKKLWDTCWWHDSVERQAQLRDAIERVASSQIARLAVSLPPGPQRRTAVDLQLVPLRDEAGSVTHLVLSSNDPGTSAPPTIEHRAAEERLRELSEATSDAFVLHDNGVVIEANTVFLRMFGYASEEIVDKNFLPMIVSPESLSAVLQRVRAGDEGPYQAVLKRKDGATFIGEIRAKQILYRGRKVRVASVHDVTERERTLAALRHTAELLDFGDAFLEMDHEWRIVRVNTAQEKLSRKPRSKTLGRVFWEVWRDTAKPDSAYWREFHRCMQERVPVQFDAYYEPLDVWTGVTAYPTGTGGIAVFFRDATEQKNYEEALRAANEQLQMTDRRKTEFLATLGHELRNPLASIRNAVAFLKRRGPPDPSLQSAQEMIDRQVAHMVRLIDDLLDVSRINRGKLELRKERVAVAVIVDQAIEIARPHLQHDFTVLLPSEPIYVDADPMRLAQVFSNLLNNAAKFTERGGRISLTAERDGAEVTIAVQDEGIGISAEQLPGLFEIFSQAAPALERAQGGLGIGLALCRGLVEMHGGRIEASSEGLGQGSEFVVHLPLAESAVAQPGGAKKNRGEANVTAQRCLVADDNDDAANSVAMLLRLDGNDVEIARDGIEAVEKARIFMPQFILLDIGMPRMNGYDACRAIRSQPGGRNMTIVALTGWGQEEDRRKAMEAGFDNHLTKPVDYSALRDLLASVSKGPRDH